MFIFGAVFTFLSAVFIAITVIWYMILVADQYFQAEILTGTVNTGSQGQRYIWGYGLYIGWGAFVLQLLSVFSFCCVLFDDDEEDNVMENNFGMGEFSGNPYNQGQTGRYEANYTAGSYRGGNAGGNNQNDYL